MNFKRSTTKTGANGIQQFFATEKLHFTTIEVGIFSTIPKTYVFQSEVCHLFTRLNLRQFVFIFIVYGVDEYVPRFHAVHVRFHLDGSVFTRYHGRNYETFTSKIIKTEMGFGHANQFNVAVQTTVKREIRHLRIYVIVGRVIDKNCNLIFLFQRCRHVHTPGRITAVVVRQFFPVYVHVCRRICATNF